MKKIFFLILIFYWTLSNANNIKVQNTTLTNIHQASGWIHVETSINWRNSWRINNGIEQWDAAWIFVKYKINDSSIWKHATINQSNTVEPTGSKIDVSADNLGAFLYRDSLGSGFFDVINLRLRWDYIADGVTSTDIVEVKVFAVEMALVPQGSFYLGAGTPGAGGGGGTNTEDNMFGAGGTMGDGGGDGDQRVPYHVTSEEEITVEDSTDGVYYDTDNPNAGDQSGTISVGYPKGFDAFYCMKYEVSEQQWIDFFNSLVITQKNSNDITGIDGKNTDATINRNTISWFDGLTQATTQAPTRAVSFISYHFASNYLSWSGLRYMTEFEYEKASRGPSVPTRNGYAWATSTISSTAYNLTNVGAFNENITNPSTNIGNASYNITDGTLNGPLRTGIFAASAINSTRKESGGSYYGIMELSGNLKERCITVGTSVGRNYSGQHGTGNLPTSGNSNTFPNVNAQGFRGGSFFDDKNLLKTSDRGNAKFNNPVGLKHFGLRGVRSAL